MKFSLFYNTCIFFRKREDVAKLSEQRLKVKNATVPLPLYSGLHVKRDVSAKNFCGELLKRIILQMKEFTTYSSLRADTSPKSSMAKKFAQSNSTARTGASAFEIGRFKKYHVLCESLL